MKDNMINPIPLKIALQLCDEIREETDRIWYPIPARWCLSCEEQAGSEPMKRGFMNKPGNRGCFLINTRYAELTHKASSYEKGMPGSR